MKKQKAEDNVGFESWKDGEKHLASVRYLDAQGKGVYRVFEGKTEKEAMAKAKKGIV